MKQRQFIFGALLLCAAYLALTGLDNAYFWDDEALLAIHSKNLLATGKLTAWDGRHLAAYDNGILLDDRLETRDAPFQYWVTALSFKIFGASTWAGRFPSVLFGLAGLWIFFLIVRNEAKNDNTFIFYAVALLAFSMTFLLNIRQCRYYSHALFFSLLTFYFYRRVLVTKWTGHFIGLGAAAALLFLSQFLLAAAFLLALAAVFLLFHRKAFGKSEWIKLAGAVGLFAVATLPYAISHQVWVRHETPQHELWHVRKPILFWWNLRELNAMNCLPWLLIIVLGWFLFRNRKQPLVKQCAFPWFVLSLGFVVFISLLSFQGVTDTGEAYMRYLIPAVPFLMGVMAAGFRFVHGRFPLVALTLFLVFINTNLFTLSPGVSFRWFLPAYLKEIHYDYPTAYRAATDFLKANAAQDDAVATHPGYCSFPLMFYAGEKVRLNCLLNERSQLPASVVKALPVSFYVEDNFPHWVIAFSKDPYAVDLLHLFSRPHREGNRMVNYQYRLETNLNMYWFDVSRPEVPWHSFGPLTDFDPSRDSVYVLKRVENYSTNDPGIAWVEQWKSEAAKHFQAR